MSRLGFFFRILSSLCFVSLLVCLCVFPIQCFDIFSYLTFGHQWYETLSYSSTILDSKYLSSLNIKHEWLSYSLFYAAFKLYGFKGVILLKSGVICLVGLLTSLFFWNRIFLFVTYQFLFSCSIIFSLYRIISRSSLFSDLLLLLFVILIVLFLSGRIAFVKVLFYFAFLMLLWANLHPGFLIGIAIIWAVYFGIYLFYKNDALMLEIKDYFFKIACLVTLVSFVHPLGIYSWRYTLNFVIFKLPHFRVYIKEWAPGMFFYNNTYEFVLIGAALFFLITLFCLIQIFLNKHTLPERIKVVSFLFLSLFIGYFILSFISLRFFKSWFLLQPFIITFLLMRLSMYNKTYKKLLSLDYSIITFFCLFCIVISYFRLTTFFIDNRRFGVGLDDRILPVEYVMKYPKLEHPNLFSVHSFGGFFSFFYYGQKMYINGFVTEKKMFDLYYDVINYKSDKLVSDFFDNYQINTVVLPLKKLELYKFFKNNNLWEQYYDDKVVVAFRRKIN